MQDSRSIFRLLALSNFGGKTEKCGRRHFHFANFANLSGHSGDDELQRDWGRQQGKLGSVQVGTASMWWERKEEAERDMNIVGLPLLLGEGRRGLEKGVVGIGGLSAPRRAHGGSDPSDSSSRVLDSSWPFSRAKRIA